MANGRFWILGAALCSAAATFAAEPTTFIVKMLTPETALKAAQAAMAKCRADGFQVAVAVVDRSGLTQVLLRDRFAGPHTVETAPRKAWTAVSFRAPTSELDREMQPGKPSGGVRHIPGVAAVAGGLVIEAGGSILGAIGVSGAPGPANDEACATAGIRAIAESLEF
jgi:uncharacterized protein GlcG (DUF336 family)